MSPKKKTNADAAQAEYIAAIEVGLGPEGAAAASGLDPGAEKDLPDQALVARAEGEALGKIERMLFEQAFKGKITAMIFWLANRSPERWKHVSSIGKGELGGGLTALEQTIKDLDEQ